MSDKMGKIYEFKRPEKKDKRAKEQPEPTELEQSNLLIFFVDLTGEEKYKPLLNTIGQVNIKSTEVYLDDVKNLSNTQLISEIENSTSGDWNSKPAYYRAITDEMYARVRKYNPYVPSLDD